MPTRIVLLAILSILSSSVARSATPTVDDLLKQCADKTIVLNRDGKKVGEDLDGYCVAYLEATLDAMKNATPALCDYREDRTPEYLLSVLQTYLKDAKVDKSSEASKTLLAAYRRAFTCGTSKK